MAQAQAAPRRLADETVAVAAALRRPGEGLDLAGFWAPAAVHLRLEGHLARAARILPEEQPPPEAAEVSRPESMPVSMVLPPREALAEQRRPRIGWEHGRALRNSLKPQTCQP